MTEGQYIQKIRKKNKLTQLEVSKKVGFDNAILLSMIENGRAKIPLARAVELCKALKMTEKERTELSKIVVREYQYKVWEAFQA